MPGLAVCWNHLPKDLWSESVPSPAPPETETILPPDLPQTVALPEVQAEEMSQLSIYPVQDAAIRQVSQEPQKIESPLDFESLKLHLKTLGVSSYSLQKWGNSGELFLFSCLVSPTEPHTYEKHFQFIGSDAIAVIQTVIADIERWKSGR